MYKDKKLNNKKHVGADASVCPILGKTQNNGITLIALVITIIVMLILVAVTVSMAINGGLFEKAGEAVGDTKNELNKEQELANGRIQIDGVWYDSIDDYLNNNPSANQGAGGSGETGGGTEGEEPGGEGGAGEGIAASELPTTEYGKTVNYGVTYTDASTYGEGKWEIFYADENHIYLITKGHLATGSLPISGYNGTADFTEANLSTKFPAVKQGLLNKTYDPLSVGSELKYTSSYENMKATEYLLDSTKWSSYVNNDYADWAIGAPTLELFVKSYNAYYTDKPDVTIETPSGTGYKYDDALYSDGSVPQGTYLNHYTSATTSPYFYWLACPSRRIGSGSNAVRYVDGNGAYVSTSGYSYYIAFRPVVCLKSGVSVKWNSTTNQYDLVK